MKGRPQLRKIALFSTVAAALIATTAMTARAHPRHRNHGMGPGGFGDRFEGRAFELRDRIFQAVEKLDLSEAQKTKLREIRRSAPAALMPRKQALVEARMDMHDLMAKKDADPNELRKAHEKVMRARDALQSAAFELRMQLRETLTPEQREQLKRNLLRGRPRGDRGQSEF